MADIQTPNFESVTMSHLFTPHNIGNVEIKNRFVHSATYEAMALETGEVTDRLIERCRNPAKGDVGLIIPGHMFVHPRGRAMKYQAGIHSDKMIPGLKRLVDEVHSNSGKIAFQLAHGGAASPQETHWFASISSVGQRKRSG